MEAMVSPIKQLPELDKLHEYLELNNYPVHVWGLDRVVRPLVMEALEKDYTFRLIVTYDEARARQLYEDCKFYDRNIYVYPAKDALFYYADIHGNETARTRMEIFKQIAENKKATIIVTIEGLMDKIPSLENIKKNIVTIKQGEEIDITKLKQRLSTMGYENVSIVEGPGQFLVRGGIIDIFPLTEECPCRVELWGDEVDSLRLFEVESQRSIEQVKEINIFPAGEMVLTNDIIQKGLKKIEAEHKEYAAKLKKEFRTEQYARINKYIDKIKEELNEFNAAMGLDSLIEYFYDDATSFLDYFGNNTMVYIDEPEKVKKKAIVYAQEFAMSMHERLKGGYVLPTQANVLYEGSAIIARLASRKTILFSELYKKQNSWGEKENILLDSKGLVSYNNSFEDLMSDIKKWRGKDYSIVILSPSATRAKRLVSNFAENEVTSFYSDNKDRVLGPKEIMVTIGTLEKGFIIPKSKLVVISEEDIFITKDKKKRKKLPKYKGDKINSFADITVGDYVVHERHGVGIYKGIEKVKTEGRERDYINIEYAKGSVLFIPVEQLDVVNKFSGKDGAKPKLNKLGGQEWEKVRQNVKSHVADIANELVELYAIRQEVKGYKYPEDTTWQREFEEIFPYEETYDQNKAINDTKKDMESDGIMDRLVCGDVGFGKTEVAIRAAFKAVQDNRQVVYLVPTTILAQQHYNTFKSRMKNYPINIRMLSRFCTTKESKEVREGLKNGSIDIVVGTHRLLSKDVCYKNLGLLIIDEEQRFGVKHKEAIKQIKNNVDVLTLTATPIPRTLHMSLIGLRDISLLEEAPVDRRAIQTYVMEHDIEFVKEAINRELSRDGQVYYVYNRVNNIEEITNQLRAILPNSVVEFAHGKMNERELERIMFAFINKEIDVLVSTTIIETGLDIPNVNTIIIHDADNFGLSQLYQLRGRVGRSNRTAYAFLMYKRDKMIKEVAEKRLKAIREFTDLGSGYKISMKDLEIRGAGNLLGSSQSGHMEAVGYELYCKMLNDAIKRLKNEEVIEEVHTSLELPLDAYIPDEYVKNELLKLELYKRISKIGDKEDQEAIEEELLDRFGAIPKPIYRLLNMAYIKVMAQKAYIQDIQYIDGEVKFHLIEKPPVHFDRIEPLLKKYRKAKTPLRTITGKKSGFGIKLSKLIQEDFLDNILDVIEDIKTLTD